jgi:hypothetical protein
MIAAVLAGEAAVYEWIESVSRPPSRPDTASLSGGRVTFRIPPGWRSGACPGDAECVHLRTPHGNADAVTVDVFRPFPLPSQLPSGIEVAIAVDSATRPGARSFTVDGIRLTRWHADAVVTPVAQPATTSVSGTLPDGSRIFIWCVEKAEPRLVRSGCEAVIGSLHVRR